MARAASLYSRAISRVFPGRPVRRICPICRWAGKQFATGGASHKRRFDCRCPRCGSIERQRLAYMVASTRRPLDYSRVIHVAPEKELAKWLRSNSQHYLSIDLSSRAMAKMDITKLDLDDNSQTLLWASHVLEHVIDDRKAISEIYRVLEPGGVAFIQVPIWRTTTIEDATVSTAEDRLRKFFHASHVRLYGLDITDRFAQVGFTSEIFRAQDFGPDAVLQFGLSFASTNEVFVFQK
jgi:predicted SAM-dependent methyltransferase